MPGGNRTGPMGMGPMSGRAAGFCTNNRVPGFMNRFFGRGFGGGSGWAGAGFDRGGGRSGWRNMFWNTGLPGWMRFGSYSTSQPNPGADNEKRALESQVEFLKSQLDQLQKRLSEMESKDTES